MIIVRIWEGLGNQLFQYAYARSLQQRTQIPIYLDVRHNNRGDLPCEKEEMLTRKLGIQHFKISLKGIRTNEIAALNCLDKTGAWGKIQYLLLKQGHRRWRVVSDETVECDLKEDILKPGNNTYVSAHCVNKKYYDGCRDILLQELRLNKPIAMSEGLKQVMNNRNTVSIHIRLTDYLRNPSAVCKQIYYNNAIRYIESRVDDPCFIVFTDDYKMARKMYKFRANTYWAGEDGYKDYEELILMSRCRHNIIAQSTFSYWGAWLNQNPEKIVVAPRHLFGGSLYEKGWKVV